MGKGKGRRGIREGEKKKENEKGYIAILLAQIDADKHE